MPEYSYCRLKCFLFYCPTPMQTLLRVRDLLLETQYTIQYNTESLALVITIISGKSSIDPNTSSYNTNMLLVQNREICV